MNQEALQNWNDEWGELHGLVGLVVCVEWNSWKDRSERESLRGRLGGTLTLKGRKFQEFPQQPLAVGSKMTSSIDVSQRENNLRVE